VELMIEEKKLKESEILKEKKWRDKRTPEKKIRK
jgi:hypothetical protein